MQGTPAMYFKALNRPHQVMGVEKSLFFINLMLATSLIFTAMFAWPMVIAGVVLFMLGHAAGVLITRADSLMVTVYKRHIRYKHYYAPIAGIHASPSPIEPSVPFYQGKKGLV